MKKAFLITSIMISTVLAQEKRHEVGWEDGIKYAYNYKPVSLGIRISPSFDYTDGDQNPWSSNSNPYTTKTSSENNSERRKILIGFQLFRQYSYASIISIEPFSEIGYSFAWNQFNSSDNSIEQGGIEGIVYDTSASGRTSNSYDNVIFGEIGIRPGFIIKERIKVYARYGLDFNVNISRTRTYNYRDTRRGDEPRKEEWSSRNASTVWHLSSFGNTSLTSGIYISFLF